MISRRSFLGVLACLPWVGKMIWQPQPAQLSVAFDWSQVEGIISNSNGGDQILITTGKEAYAFNNDATVRRLADYYAKTQIDAWNAAWDKHAHRLTFAEWDKRYQA